MNELMIFEGKEVEIIEINGQILFNPYDVGRCLDMAEGTVKDHMSKMSDKQAILIKNSAVGLTNFRKLNNAGEKFLTESGVYKLVFKSRKPNAERFTDWVSDEVLPSIRKTGMYSARNISKNQIPLKEQVESLEVVADMLRMNDTSKLLILENFYKDYGIPTGFLQKYEHNGSNIELFENKGMNISVRTMLNEDGSIFVNAEDTAIGFGWTQEDNGKMYVRWEIINRYCKELGFSQFVGKDDYIPESLFYRLGMKANNAKAEKFQNWLAMEVIPSVHKTGMYSTNNGRNQIPLKEQVESLEAVANMFRMNKTNKLLMLERFYKDYNIPTNFIPKYEHNCGEQMKTLTALLKEHGYKISPIKFNQILLGLGYLEERERTSSNGEVKKFKALTDKGLQYGKNNVNSSNQEVQLLYYTDKFAELYQKVVQGK